MNGNKCSNSKQYNIFFIVETTLDNYFLSKRRKEKEKENQDSFIRRVFAEWQDLKEYRLDMDQVLRLKDRQIISLENELRVM